MSENCNHDCSSCGEDCPSRSGAGFQEPQNKYSNVMHVIGVVSGKGGVGKSVVTSLLACEMARRGYSVAVMDADITGPSIPRLFGVHGKAEGGELGLMPGKSAGGVKVMSINMLLENDTDPVVWRGPMIAGVVKQFWTDVAWGQVDYMFVDMPPGTGDVPLTVFQSLPLDGVVIVTSPQELVSMIVGKAVKMANLMSISVLGVIENMAYFKCPDCGREHRIFGESGIERFAHDYGIEQRTSLPIDPALAAFCDGGRIEDYKTAALAPIADKLTDLL